MISKGQNVLVIACVLLACILPVEKGTKAEKGITPAVVIPEFIKIKEKKEDVSSLDNLGIEKEQLENSNSEKTDSGNTVAVKVVESIEVDITQPKKLKKHSVKKKKRAVPPICKHTMHEIFLFQRDDGNNESGGNITLVPPILVPSQEEEITILPIVPIPTEIPSVTESEVTKPEDDDMKLKVADMHSFEEWKKLKRQEQESRLAESEPGTIRTVRAKKTRVNYASQDCGAKVLAHNREANHVSAILDENRDMYMLNPCSKPIWFVIELCEPIQVEQIQLGNMELFSSAPKEFSVSVSERYPSRDWQSIGSFEASNVKSLQTFNVIATDVMFAKYIRFEMKSHFSNEHFCPLTLVRIMGVSMVDEFDQSDHGLSKTDEDDTSSDGDSGTSAEEVQQNDSGPINKMFNMVKNAMGLADKNAKDEDQNIMKENRDNETGKNDPGVESEVTLVTNDTDIAVPRKELVTLIKSGNGEDLPSHNIPICIPKFIQYLSPATQKLNARVCWILEFFCKVSLAGCLVHYPFNVSSPGAFVSFSVSSLDEIKDTLSPKINELNEDVSNDSDLPIPEVFLKCDKKDDGLKAFELSMSGTTPGQNDISLIGQTSIGEDLHVDAAKEQPSASLVSQEPVKVNSNEESSTVDENIKMDGKIDAKDAVKLPEIERSNVNDTSNSSSTENISFPSTPTPIDSAGILSTPKQISNESAVDKQQTHPTVVINPGTSQKDSVFMRLSNRIRVLEQNMSLSSDYLENLSRRYKEQMDEMQRAFNQTTSKLVATSRTANENDAKQTELLKQVQAEVEVLKIRIDTLSTAHDLLNEKLVERHLCLILLELIIFVAVFVTCLGRRIGHTQRSLERSNAMINQLENMIKDFNEKHSSAVPMPSGRRSNSVPTVTPLVTDQPVIANGNVHHGKKSKKRHKRRNSHDNITAIANQNNADAKVPSIGYSEDRMRSAKPIEVIGGTYEKPRIQESCCLPRNNKAWNSGRLHVKNTGSYVKGRK